MSSTAHEMLDLPAHRRITLPPIWAGSASVDLALLGDRSGAGRLFRITPAAGLDERADNEPSIEHPNLLGVRGVKMTDEGPVLLSDYNGGATLGELLQLGARVGPPMPTEVAVAILLGAFAALSALHAHGMPHGALSPRTIHVGDDGIARLTDPRFERRMSRASRSRRVELAYTAPEGLAGEPPSMHSDVFSMGIIAWEALAGRRLFRGESDADTTRKIVAKPAPRLSRVAPFLGAHLDNVIAKALEKAPQDRFDAIIGLSATLETIAARSGRIADPEEVADYVRSVMGEALSRRRALLAAIAIEVEPSTLQSADLEPFLSPESDPAPAAMPAPPAPPAPSAESTQRSAFARPENMPPLHEPEPPPSSVSHGRARPRRAERFASEPSFTTPSTRAWPSYAPTAFSVPPAPPTSRSGGFKLAIATLVTLGPVIALAFVAWRSSIVPAPASANAPIQVAAAHGPARAASAPGATKIEMGAPSAAQPAPAPAAASTNSTTAAVATAGATSTRPAEAPRAGRSAAVRASSPARPAQPAAQRRAEPRRPARPAQGAATPLRSPAAEAPASVVPVNPYGP